jgi:phosphoglycolate phosphatase-like HAD superfamily hydrolase
MKTIVFDFDGTLLDSRLRHKIVLSEILTSQYLPNESIDLDDFVKYKGEGNTTLNYLVEKYKFALEDAAHIAQIWQNKIEDYQYLQYDVLFFDTIPVLTKLEDRYRMVLLSARQNAQFLYQQLEELEVFNYFDEIKCVSTTNVVNEKYKVLKEEGDIVLSIGDTEVDYNAAKQLSIPFYALNRGFRNKNYWDSLNVNSFSNLDYIALYLEDEVSKDEFQS